MHGTPGRGVLLPLKVHPPDRMCHVPVGLSRQMDVSWLVSESGFGARVMQPDLFHVTKSSLYAQTPTLQAPLE